MLKIIDSRVWDSTGNEFIEMLEKNGINYNILYKGLKIFDAVSLGFAGGTTFDIIEYIRPSNGKRVIAANGGFGAGDFVLEEVYLFEVDDNEKISLEELAEVLRNYIKEHE